MAYMQHSAISHRYAFEIINISELTMRLNAMLYNIISQLLFNIYAFIFTVHMYWH